MIRACEGVLARAGSVACPFEVVAMEGDPAAVLIYVVRVPGTDG